MPLNMPNLSKFKPKMVGPVKLQTRSSTRARLFAGGTYFRSISHGESQNLIKVSIFESGVGTTKEGVCIIQNTLFVPSEQIEAIGVSPDISLFKLLLNENEVIKIEHNGTEWRATNTGIRWQIAPGAAPFPPIDLGQVRNGLFNNAKAFFKVSAIESWPLSATIILRPRTRRYPLVVLSSTETSESGITTQVTGWDPQALRHSINSDDTAWIYMPSRGTPASNGGTGIPVQASHGEDVQDFNEDAKFLLPFLPTNLTGGNGLPTIPLGINTGPDRVLCHLNYAEKDDGSMGELNQVFEWVGDSAVTGSWSRYI